MPPVPGQGLKPGIYVQKVPERERKNVKSTYSSLETRINRDKLNMSRLQQTPLTGIWSGPKTWYLGPKSATKM